MEQPVIKVEQTVHVVLADMNKAVEMQLQLVPLSCQFEVVSQLVQSVLLVQAVHPCRVTVQSMQTELFMYWVVRQPHLPATSIFGGTHTAHDVEILHWAQFTNVALQVKQVLVAVSR